MVPGAWQEGYVTRWGDDHLPKSKTKRIELGEQVGFNSDVVAHYRLIGYENRDVCRRLWQSHSLDFRNDTVDAGEGGAGHSATALCAVTFRPNANGRIATVQLRWEDPDTYQVTEINGISTPGIWPQVSNRLMLDTNWP